MSVRPPTKNRLRVPRDSTRVSQRIHHDCSAPDLLIRTRALIACVRGSPASHPLVPFPSARCVVRERHRCVGLAHPSDPCPDPGCRVLGRRGPSRRNACPRCPGTTGRVAKRSGRASSNRSRAASAGGVYRGCGNPGCHLGNWTRSLRGSRFDPGRACLRRLSDPAPTRPGGSPPTGKPSPSRGRSRAHQPGRGVGRDRDRTPRVWLLHVAPPTCDHGQRGRAPTRREPPTRRQVAHGFRNQS